MIIWLPKTFNIQEFGFQISLPNKNVAKKSGGTRAGRAKSLPKLFTLHLILILSNLVDFLSTKVTNQLAGIELGLNQAETVSLELTN